MRRRKQDRERGYDSEQRKYNKAQSIDHHRGKLPVPSDVTGLVLLTQLVGNKTYFFKDESELVVSTDTRVVRYERLVQAAAVAVVLVLSVDGPEEGCRGQRCRSAPGAMVVPEVIVYVEHVGEQALGGAVLEFHVLQVQRLAVRGHRGGSGRGRVVVLARAVGPVHAQDAWQPVQEHHFYLKYKQPYRQYVALLFNAIRNLP